MHGPMNDASGRYSKEWWEWQDPELPDYLDPLWLVLGKHLATERADKPALIADGVPVSYRELAERVERVALGLADIGCAPDVRVLLFGTDSVDYLVTWLAIIRCGGVPVVVSDLHKAPQLLYFLEDTGAQGLVLDVAQWAKWRLVAGEAPKTLGWVLVHGEVPLPPLAGPPGVTVRPWDAALSSGAAAVLPDAKRHRDDMAYLFYSGGTTGPAKGIVHCARDFLLVPERHGAYWEYRDEDVVYATSKKYFTHGLWPGVLIPWYFGATAVIHGAAPSAEVVLDVLERYGVTKWITVPTVVKNVLLHLGTSRRRVNVDRLQLAACASEKMPPELFERFYEQFGVELLDSIGSSEVTYEWIANRPRDFRRGSLGRPVWGCTIRLVNDAGEIIQEPGVAGEAWVRSATAPLFYWRKWEKTKATFVGEWTRTGDALYFDEDGYFWYSGRMDDLFKVQGKWVSPLEIEAAITEHDAVLEAAVIPYEADAATYVKAFVVARPGVLPSSEIEEAIRERVRQIGGYKVPKEMAWVGELPRTALLKIDRRRLRLEEASRRSGQSLQ